jgi:excisionase family DNA binding protein
LVVGMTFSELTQPPRNRHERRRRNSARLNSGRPDIPPALLSDWDAAARLGVSRATIWRLAAAGRLNTVKILGATRFKVEQIDRIAEEGASS